VFKLIGLAGKAGSGKNELANYIESFYSEMYRQDSFAAPIKSAIAAMLCITVDELEELKNENAVHPSLDKSYREILQTLGTEWGRNLINSDIWTLLAKGRIIDNHKVATIMTDVRFNNEAELIHNMGGKVIYIDRPSSECRDAGTHISENALDEELIDYVIINDGDIDLLRKRWNDLMYLIS